MIKCLKVLFWERERGKRGREERERKIKIMRGERVRKRK